MSDKECLLLLVNISDLKVREAIVSNKKSAVKYLTGKWQNENGYTMEWEQEVGLTDGMPRVISGDGYYEIKGGIMYSYTDSDSTRKADKRITITDMNHWEVYCYANGRTYTMTRIG